LQTGKFTTINEAFRCLNCGKDVLPASRGCRNHCPFCLHSQHVDRYPGDRQNPCGGLLKPIGYELSGKKGLVILFKCSRCGEENKNVASLDCTNQPDDYDSILGLSTGPQP